jgi:hypothetical protein
MKRSPSHAQRTVHRQPGPPQEVVTLSTGVRLYAVPLSSQPSRAWRAAFLRPPVRLTTPRGTPDVGRVNLRDTTVEFRTTPLPWWVATSDRPLDPVRQLGGGGVIQETSLRPKR